MTKKEIKEWVNNINAELSEISSKQLEILNISNDYIYNKAVALIEKDNANKGWYGTDYKNCYKTWAEIEAFIEGFCKCKNTTFNESER